MVILTDTGTDQRIPCAFVEAAQELGGKTTLVTIPRPDRPGQEPAGEMKTRLEEALDGADVFLLITSVSQSHIAAVALSRKKGTRGASMPGITPAMMNCLADPGLKTRVDRVIKSVSGATSALLTTPRGTKIEFLLNEGEYPWLGEAGDFTRPGDFGNLPSGEVACRPLSAKGILITDGCLTTPIGKVDIPFSIRIEGGMAKEILGEGKAVSLLRQMLKEAAEKLPFDKKHLVYNIAELGIGMNSLAGKSGTSLEEEKRCRENGTNGPSGTLHVALGNDLALGGKVNAGIHIDNIIECPTLTVFWPNGKKRRILSNGILVV